MAAIRNLAFAVMVAVGLGAADASAEELTVTALGDSLTQGYGLPPEEGFVAQLGRWLEGQGADVRLVNAGVSGDTTAGGLARIDWTLADAPDALIVALGGNDVLRGIDPAASRANLDGILARAEAASIPVLLVGISVPANYGPDYQEAFSAIYPDLAQSYDALLYPDFLAALTEGSDRKTALGEFMQADGIHPNAAGVGRIVEAIGPAVLKLIERAG